jgi:hypothetical protein
MGSAGRRLDRLQEVNSDKKPTASRSLWLDPAMSGPWRQVCDFAGSRR